MTSLDRIASWILRNRHTKAVVCETFNPVDVMRLNTAKYEAVPILEYLQELNAHPPADPNRSGFD